MSFSTLGQRTLRRALGALSLAFMTAATPAFAKKPESAPDIGTGSTSMSDLTRSIERRANEYARERGAPIQIHIADIDEIVATTTSQPLAYPLTYSRKVAYFFNYRGLNLSRDDQSRVQFALRSLYGPHAIQAQAIHVSTTDNTASSPNACIVIPSRTDFSSRGQIDEWVGNVSPYILTSAVNPGAYKMLERVIWHEVWHCLDRNFLPHYNTIHPDKGMERALARHKAEMFADVAATLTMATQGDEHMVRITSDLRAIHSRWNGPKMTSIYSPKVDEEHSAGITYYLTPGQDAISSHIKQIGIRATQSYTLADVERVADTITNENALPVQRFKDILSLYKNGEKHVQTLQKQAEGGNDKARDSAEFLAAYLTRADAAQNHVTWKTSVPTPAYEDVAPPRLDELLDAVPAHEKQEIKDAVWQSIQRATRNQQSPRAGVMNQLEIWQKAVHRTDGRSTESERTLHIAHLMLANGDMDQFLAPSPQNPSPRP